MTLTAADWTPILGIDLGTTYSAVAVVCAGKVEIIPNQEGELVTPSVVAFSPEGGVLVGSPAVRQATLNPHRTVDRIKRRLGRDTEEESCYEVAIGPNGARVRIDGTFFTPAEIAALILKKLLEAAEEYLGVPARRAVLAVPASFDVAQLQATLDAALLAGIDVQWIRENPRTRAGYSQPLRVINEPTAAILSLGRPTSPRTVAVVRMGGGSCDVGIFEHGDGVVQVLALAGDSRLGGEDFDRAILDWCEEEIRLRYDTTIRRSSVEYHRLRDAAEQAKKELSQNETARIFVPHLLSSTQRATTPDLTVTRSEFEGRCSVLIERFRSLVTRALREARLGPAGIDLVLLSGGSMRMPRLRELARELLGRDPVGIIHTPEAVACGAAIYGAQLLLGASSELLLVNVAPHSLGVEDLDGRVVEILARNTPIPAQSSKSFTTASAGQRGVSVRVRSASAGGDDRLLAQLDLEPIESGEPGQVRIEVVVSMDHDGIAWVTVREPASGLEKTIRLAGGRRMSPAEADELRRKTETGGLRRLGMEGARKRAASCLGSLESWLRERPADLDVDSKERMRILMEEVRRAMDGNDPDTLLDASKCLDSAVEAMRAWASQRNARANDLEL